MTFADESLWMPAPAPAARELASPATRRLLRRYIARRVPACDVDDVVQATLCDAIASARAPSPEPDLLRWLIAIARFKVADVHRASARTLDVDPGEIAAPPSPVDALSLARWVERQAPPGEGAARTLEWMLREAEGDKLESIAAEENLPAERVRQRVSRLRRWMRERWMAELAAVAIVALASVGALRVFSSHRAAAGPAIVAEPSTADDARLRGPWTLIEYTPVAPLPTVRRALFEQIRPGFEVDFDGRLLRASGADGSFARGYAVTQAADGQLQFVDPNDSHAHALTYAWEGEILLIEVPSGPWAGTARFRRGEAKSP